MVVRLSSSWIWNVQRSLFSFSFSFIKETTVSTIFCGSTSEVPLFMFSICHLLDLWVNIKVWKFSLQPHQIFDHTNLMYIYNLSIYNHTKFVISHTSLLSTIYNHIKFVTTPNSLTHSPHITTSIFWPHQIDVHVQQDTLYPTTPNVITPNMTTPNHCWQTLYNYNKFLTSPNEVRCTTCTTTTRPHQIANHRESSPSMTDIFLDFTPWVHVSVHVHIFK